MPRWTVSPTTAIVLLALAFLAPTAADAGEDLSLRVNDVKGVAGSVVAVEVRTYAPRGVGQGQICLRSAVQLDSSTAGSRDDGGSPASSQPDLAAVRLAGGEDSGILTLAESAVEGPDSPFVGLEGVAVLSALGDSTSSVTFDAGTQTAIVDFSSPSGTINNADGPLAIFYFRLRDDLEPDQEFQLVLDPGVTFLVDDAGNHVVLELKPGRLRIEKPNGNCTY